MGIKQGVASFFDRVATKVPLVICIGQGSEVTYVQTVASFAQKEFPVFSKSRICVDQAREVVSALYG